MSLNKTKITKLKKGKFFLIPSKYKIKVGDQVEVRSGSDKRKQGQVLKVMPKFGKAIVEGINMVTKHIKPNKAESKPGSKINMEAPIDICKLMYVDSETGQKIKVGRKMNDDGKLCRYSKATGKFI